MKAEWQQRGPRSSAELLLDYLVIYKDWFPCLLSVLRHEDIRQAHVAQQLSFIKGDQIILRDLFEIEEPWTKYVLHVIVVLFTMRWKYVETLY